MDNQARTRAIKASILKLGYDELALTEIMYQAKGRLREIAVAAPWQKKQMAEATTENVFAKLKGKYKGKRTL